MLFIGGYIIQSKNLKEISKLNIKLSAKEIIELIIDDKSAKVFYDSNKLEYDYKIVITSKQELKNFLDFFSKFELSDKEFLEIKRYGINLKETYEVIKEYKNNEIIDKIYVEQFEKNEFLNFEDYTVIYDFLKNFEKTLPNYPSKLDIIVNAYDYVKKQEYLREKDDSSTISKMFSTSILSPYIVCAGFVKQFNCLLKEYNIPCFDYQFKNNPKEGHVVSLVHIENKGIYFFDITRDSYDRNITELENQAKYSGFMLPYTDYSNNNLLNDNYSKELFKKVEALELRKRYAEQEMALGKDRKIDIFNQKNFKNAKLLHTLIDTNMELLKEENFFEIVSENEHQTNSNIYNGLLKINESFGEDIKDADFFIETLLKAKRNTKLKDNTKYITKAVISRFQCRDTIDLSKTIGQLKNS